MNKITLTLPGQTSPIPNPEGLNPQFSGINSNLATLISPLLNIAFYLAIFFAFYWLIWGTFQYILASGNKENLAKARARIKWALIGLVVVFASFLIAKLAGQVFAPVGGEGALPF